MKKTTFIKLLLLCFISIAYLPFFNANTKADTLEPKINIDGVEEGKTYQKPTIKFSVSNARTVYKYKVVTESGKTYEYQSFNEKKDISLMINENGNIVFDQGEAYKVINKLQKFSFEDDNINVNDNSFKVKDGIVYVDNTPFDLSSLFEEEVAKGSLVLSVKTNPEDGKSYYYLGDECTDLLDTEKIKEFKLEETIKTKIVAATLNGEEFQTNTTLKSKMYKNGKYTLVVTDSEGNSKTVNFILNNKTYIAEILPILLKGAKSSLLIFVITLLFGIPLGLFGCVLKKVTIKPFKFIKSDNKFVYIIKNFNPLKMLLDLYTWVIRGTPLMLQLFVVYFGIPIAFGKEYALSPINAACITFVINYTAYFIEIFRGGMESINKGQFSSCYVLGMTKTQTYIRIIIPQTIKRSLPSITNEAITLIKDTALANVVTVYDLMFYTKEKVSHDFRLDAYVVAAILYLAFSFVIVFVFRKIEKRNSFYN